MFYGPSRHTMRRRDSLARQHTHSVQALALAFLPGVTPLMDAVMHGQHAAVLAFMQAVRLYTTPSFDIAHLLCRVPHAKSHGIHSKTEARPAAVCRGLVAAVTTLLPAVLPFRVPVTHSLLVAGHAVRCGRRDLARAVFAMRASGSGARPERPHGHALLRPR